MRDKVFIDTNVLIYFVSAERSKKWIAKELLVEKGDFIQVISSQVIGEFVNTCIKKALLTKKEAYTVAEVFMNSLEFFLIDEKVLYKSFDINIRYKYSFWDSLIIASALIAGCSILYTEDMQHSQLIDGNLRIVNPFL